MESIDDRYWRLPIGVSTGSSDGRARIADLARPFPVADERLEQSDLRLGSIGESLGQITARDRPGRLVRLARRPKQRRSVCR